MEIKKSKVTNVQGNGTWDGKFGMMFKFDINMENGDAGEYSSKSQDQTKFVVGQEVDYEFHGGQYPRIKPHNPQYSNTAPAGNMPAFSKPNTDKDKSIAWLACLKAAADFNSQKNSDSEMVVNNAKAFYNAFLNQFYTAPEPAKSNGVLKDDMPF